MISVEEALNIIDECALNAGRLRSASETIPTSKALGRVLAESACAPMSLPIFDNSAMDGFAVRSEEVQLARIDSPIRLQITGVTRAGDPPQKLTTNRETIRIMTGAAIPDGCDAVIKQEDVEEQGEAILVARSVKKNENIRRNGEDIEQGATAVEKGKVINPAVIGFLTALGIREINVSGRPRVSILVTGSELVSSADELRPGKILESNSSLLSSGLQRLGMSPEIVTVLPDSKGELQSGMSNALERSDVILISGGVSVGMYDHTKVILKDLGVQQLFWKVAQKPGKPLYFGTKDGGSIFGLPGNPYSAFVCFYLYVCRFLLGFMGAKDVELHSSQAPLEGSIELSSKRDRFLKANIGTKNGRSAVQVLDAQGSHQLRSLCDTNVFVHVPVNRAYQDGDLVTVYYLP